MRRWDHEHCVRHGPFRQRDFVGCRCYVENKYWRTNLETATFCDARVVPGWGCGSEARAPSCCSQAFGQGARRNCGAAAVKASSTRTVAARARCSPEWHDELLWSGRRGPELLQSPDPPRVSHHRIFLHCSSSSRRIAASFSIRLALTPLFRRARSRRCHHLGGPDCAQC